MDLTPLRSVPAFRRLWTASTVSSVGGQMGVLAVTLQVFQMTGSSIAVGAIGAFVGIPTIAFSLLGGALADRYDRRALAIAANGVQLAVALAFVGQAVAGTGSLALIYALVAVQATAGAVAVPVRRTFVRTLLPAAHLPAAQALYLFSMHAGQILGPAVGGLAAVLDVGLCYTVQAATVTGSLWAAYRLPRVPAHAGPGAGADPVSNAAALRFALRSTPVRTALLVDLCMTTLGLPVALLPALNAERFGGDPASLGLLSAAIAVGGALGAVFTGFATRVRRHGVALLAAALCWAGTVLLLGVADRVWLAVLCLAAGGVADVIALTFAQTIVQNETPDEVRGRISSLEHMVQMGGPQLGNLRAGVVATAAGTAAGVVSGALAVVTVLTLIGAGSRRFRHYRAPVETATK